MYKFKAIMVKDDERSGYKKGYSWTPLGFYYNKKKIIVVGIGDGCAMRMAFPIDSVKMEITEV